MTESLSRPASETGSDLNKLETFAARCAHDFNNLLTGILGNLELMQSRARRSGVKEFDGYLEGARHAAGRAASFTQRMLAFSGRSTHEPSRVPVNRLAADLVELMREQSVTVRAELAADAGCVVCDPAQLEMALMELLTNAREATAEGGELRIATARHGACTEIAVIDAGTGMTPEVAARAAEPFFSTRPNGAGKGLGLAIADRFARNAGGRLEIESTPGTGSTIRLVLPRGPD